MPTTRERALDAAIVLVGEEGLRSLTHARADTLAGLPRGSTSNWFRTRAALIDGVVMHIAEQERADFTADDTTRPPEAFVEAFSRMIEAQTDIHATRTRARLALFLDGSDRATSALHKQRAIFGRWMRAVAVDLEMAEPDACAAALMACADGLVIHRLTIDANVPVRSVVAKVVAGCLTTPGLAE